MKKYIRTKDGVIYDTKELIKKFKKAETMKEMSEEEYTLAHKIYNNDFDNFGWKRRFDKESDTIEELCDEYVVKHINSLTPMLIDKFTISLKDIKTQYSGNDNFEYIYGAIWTDKGLIYVAKMNNKGELELI